MGLGGVFCSFYPPRPRPGPDHTQSLDGPPSFTTKILRGPVWGMAVAGPWPGVGAGKGETSTPPRAGERAGAGNFAGAPCYMGPRRPRNEHYLKCLSGILTHCFKFL